MAKINLGKDFDKNENHEKLTKRLDNLDTKPYLLRIPAALHKKVKVKLAKEEKNLRQILLDAIEQYINK